MNDMQSAPPSGPIGRLLASVGEFLATVLTIGRTRVELLTVELQLELRRLAELLIWAFVTLFAAGVALLMAGLTVIGLLWDTHRVAAVVGVTSAFLATAVVSAVVLVRKVRGKPRLLEGTLAELARDSEQLRGQG